ncbi:MAG TPA: D-alanyl-D-alanine carboxypeptidase family protein [Candidatus Binatia bacterium]
MRVWGRTVDFGLALAAALLLLLVRPASAEPEPPRITARAAVVIDANTGRILWERDASRPLPPASTTKIMTTVLALESGRLDRSFVVSPLAAAQVPTKLGLRPGQRVQLEDLVYALMLKSANDASVVVAEGLAGSVEEFAALMNERAREIGALNTTFRNPHGLPDDQHLTSAYDMALILRHALTVPGFREIAGTRTKVIQVTDTKVRPISLYSKNRLLSGYFVPVLGKTGYTRAAGRCFAGAAELNGRRIITVVFGASDMWGDTRRLMEYGFSSFEDTAPTVQAALEQQRRAQATAVARKSSKPTKSNTKSRTTTVASKSKKRPPVKQAVARKSSPSSSKKASVQTPRKQTTKSATASASRPSSVKPATASSSKPRSTKPASVSSARTGSSKSATASSKRASSTKVVKASSSRSSSTKAVKASSSRSSSSSRSIQQAKLDAARARR